MELNEYQEKAMGTCMPQCANFSYMMLNLVGELDEFASKVAKAIRRGEAWVDENHLFYSPNLCERYDNNGRFFPLEELKKEADDILWQLSSLCKVLGVPLEDVAQLNLEKLASRKERGVIDGDGDNR